MNNKSVRSVLTTGILGMAIAFGLFLNVAKAEYGDIVMNNYSSESGMRPVIFPHWFHRIRFNCKVCHSELGFKFQAGGNDINMLKLINGDYCGACHNGEGAWPLENCELCHTAKLDAKTQVHNSTRQLLVSPVAMPKKTKK